MGAMLALSCLVAGGAGAAVSWNSTLTPHFEIFHQNAFLPTGLPLEVEDIHERLRMDMGYFPQGPAERINLYLYKDRQSYAEGRFAPPPWSNGISFYSRRVVAVYDQPSEKKLLAVIAHETTHLLFESWWAEGSRQNPPDWLNEGLAMVEEAPPEQIGHSDWYEAMAALPKSDTLDLKRLMSLSPTADLHDRRARVSAWYVQSYSLVYFLLRKHSPLQFKSLCKDLRDGVEVEKALWLVYHYRSYRQLQEAWLAWLSGLNPRRVAGALGG